MGLQFSVVLSLTTAGAELTSKTALPYALFADEQKSTPSSATLGLKNIRVASLPPGLTQFSRLSVTLGPVRLYPELSFTMVVLVLGFNLKA